MIEILNPSEIGNWNDMLLSGSSQHSFFHCSEWARILQETYRYRPLYFTIRKEDRICALIPVMEVDSLLTGKRGVSLPFSDMSEPFAENRACFEEIYQHVLQYGKRNAWKYIELRGGTAYLDSNQASEHYWGHVLDLTGGIDGVIGGLRSSTWRNIKKAAKEGIQVAVSFDADAMASFVHLNEITRREHGLPPQPRSFFRNVQRHLIEEKKGFVAIASLNKQAIAGAVYFLFGDQVLYKYGASDRAFQNLRANNSVMWHTIEWCCQNGYKSLCFGRTEPENVGLRQFKTGWGARDRQLCYYRYDLRRNAFVKKTTGNGFSKRIFGHLPIPVLNTTGKMLYRHMG